jgi:hypothetical protein
MTMSAILRMGAGDGEQGLGRPEKRATLVWFTTAREMW